MKHKFAYILAVGALLFVGGGCKQGAVTTTEQRSGAGAPADTTDAAVDDILKGMTDEAAQADKVEENAEAVNATDPALDTITEGTYDLE